MNVLIQIFALIPFPLIVERESVQKKTFTKWVNSHLIRADQRIGDLYEDLRDGRKLITLLEILSGERLQKPTKGKMRIHCLENVDKALQFLLHEQRVHLENLGSHDIVDGNARLTLGLIWTIILRFQIQDIVIEKIDNQETKLAKDALLLWCQMKTAGYNAVNIRNFTTSWKDGLAFNAIIHKHRPDLIQYDKLSKANPTHNLNNAFNVAEKELGLAKLLDAEDVDTDNPDDKSIITYVVTYYHYFSKMRAETVQGKRIAKVVGAAMENDKSIEEYEKLTSDLLKWISQTIDRLNERQFENTLVGVQQQLTGFSQYRNVEKPPKFVEKGNLEILLFTLQSKMRANHQTPYLPSEGKMISDVNEAWESLEKAEHERELALREELIRQEKLEQLAARFARKAGMRETWLSENQRLVSQDNFGLDLPAVEAAAKKHEAIETDIFAYQERVQAVIAVSNDLEKENYHGIEKINARKENVLQLWERLLKLLANRRTRLEMSLGVQQSFQEMNHLHDQMDTLKQRLKSDDYGQHLVGVEDLLQKHSLLEADIKVLGDRAASVVQNALSCVDDNPDLANYKPVEPAIVQDRCQKLTKAHEQLCDLADRRKKRLQQSKLLWQFCWDAAEELAWIREKEHILSSDEIGHDLTTVNLLISKSKALEEELFAHEPQLAATLAAGQGLITANHFGAEQIQTRIDELNMSWDRLKQLLTLRSNRLAEATHYHRFFTDADDVDAWMIDTGRLLSSQHVGIDEDSSELLLKKHQETEDELRNYAQVVDALKEQAATLSEPDRESQPVRDRIASIDQRYAELDRLANERRQRLADAISSYRLYSEASSVEQWIVEKEKMLDAMVPSREMEEIEVLKHRFETFEQEMFANGSRVQVVNELADKLVNAQHGNSRDIQAKVNALNQRWNELVEQAGRKKEEMDAAHDVQTFHIECRETVTWIEEKTKLLQATEELGDDLSGIIALQRRLGTMERDLGAIKSKLDTLDREAQKIKNEHPEEVPIIEDRSRQIVANWDKLSTLVKEKDAKLEEVGDLHRFLRDLDHFQAWLSKTQKDVASEDIPASLPEAESLLEQHKQIKDEIENYEADYRNMMTYGENLTQGKTDHQHMFMRERLKALKDGWDELEQMWKNRQDLLSENLQLQMLLRDAAQADALLNKQEHYLGNPEQPATLEQAEQLLTKHETFLSTVDANNDKINAVLQYAQRLIEEPHFAADRIRRKAEQIAERRAANARRANALSERLNEQLQQLQFAQDCDELLDWLQEKHNLAQDDTYRSAKTIHSKWTRHQAFEAEIKSNKDRLYRIQEQGEQLLQHQPDVRPLVEQKLGELGQQFSHLEEVTEKKGEDLLDSNRHAIYEQSVDELEGWLNDLETQMASGVPAPDLTSVNHILKKHQTIEQQMQEKARQVDDLSSHAKILEQIEPDKKETIHAKKALVSERFQRLQEPLQQRKDTLLKKKEAYQFRRNVEDEKLWIAEKLPQAESTNYGDTLFGVQSLLKKNQSLKNEVDNHRPRVQAICEAGRKLIDEQHPDSDEFRRLTDELLADVGELNEAIESRRSKLLESEQAQLYFYDASEVEAWMGEQELYMLTEDRGKDEFSAQNLIKKHGVLDNAVSDYAEEISKLGAVAAKLIEQGHPQSDQIERKQAQVEKLYAGLKDLSAERRSKLDQALQLFRLKREFDDLLQWIADRELVAGSSELGQDYEQVSMLRDRFQAFAKDTETIGNERVHATNRSADRLIDVGHPDSATIAEYKDNLTEAWADLLEMIETRRQVLKASWELQKYFHDCKDVYGRIVEKQKQMSDELGRDAASVSNLKRKHAIFEHDLAMLRNSVETISETSSVLQVAYAGERAGEIVSREQEVLNAWNKLSKLCDLRRLKLDDTGDLFSLLNMMRDLRIWMDDLVRQMNTSEKPRDVSGVELLMNNHQGLRAEIDTREPNFAECFRLGNELISREHYASEDIRDKLTQLDEARRAMNTRWNERWEHLQLILEVYQFARDAAVAEAWLIAQDPYLLNTELGHTIDEVEQLIRKHEAFEKSAASQKERFSALELPTRVI